MAETLMGYVCVAVPFLYIRLWLNVCTSDEHSSFEIINIAYMTMTARATPATDQIILFIKFVFLFIAFGLCRLNVCVRIVLVCLFELYVSLPYLHHITLYTPLIRYCSMPNSCLYLWYIYNVLRIVCSFLTLSLFVFSWIWFLTWYCQ